MMQSQVAPGNRALPHYELGRRQIGHAPEDGQEQCGPQA